MAATLKCNSVMQQMACIIQFKISLWFKIKFQNKRHVPNTIYISKHGITATM